MDILVTYDVNTEEKSGQRRLSRVARLCKDYGLRVQNSVFECVVTEVQLLELKSKLDLTIDRTKDSIRIYYLNHNEHRQVITLGKQSSIKVKDTLII